MTSSRPCASTATLTGWTMSGAAAKGVISRRRSWARGASSLPASAGRDGRIAQATGAATAKTTQRIFLSYFTRTSWHRPGEQSATSLLFTQAMMVAPSPPLLIRGGFVVNPVLAPFQGRGRGVVPSVPAGAALALCKLTVRGKHNFSCLVWQGSEATPLSSNPSGNALGGRRPLRQRSLWLARLAIGRELGQVERRGSSAGPPA